MAEHGEAVKEESQDLATLACATINMSPATQLVFMKKVADKSEFLTRLV